MDVFVCADFDVGTAATECIAANMYCLGSVRARCVMIKSREMYARAYVREANQSRTSAITVVSRSLMVQS